MTGISLYPSTPVSSINNTHQNSINFLTVKTLLFIHFRNATDPSGQRILFIYNKYVHVYYYNLLQISQILNTNRKNNNSIIGDLADQEKPYSMGRCRLIFLIQIVVLAYRQKHFCQIKLANIVSFYVFHCPRHSIDILCALKSVLCQCLNRQHLTFELTKSF